MRFLASFSWNFKRVKCKHAYYHFPKRIGLLGFIVGFRRFAPSTQPTNLSTLFHGFKSTHRAFEDGNPSLLVGGLIQTGGVDLHA